LRKFSGAVKCFWKSEWASGREDEKTAGLRRSFGSSHFSGLLTVENSKNPDKIINAEKFLRNFFTDYGRKKIWKFFFEHL